MTRAQQIIEAVAYDPEAEKSKLAYLHAFEDAFRKKCAAAQIDPSRWKQGMWANAHMYHGQGVPVEQAVEKWFAHCAAHSRR